VTPHLFFFSSRRRHTIFSRDWSSDVCSSDLGFLQCYISVQSPHLHRILCQCLAQTIPLQLVCLFFVVFLIVIVLFVQLIYENIRSEEHTSELQSRENLVCRLLLEKKNTKITI